jgi:iron complex outermembrane recepter protein
VFRIGVHDGKLDMSKHSYRAAAFAAASVVLGLNFAAHAQEPKTLQKIQVEEAEDDNAAYAATRATAATKTDTPLNEIPQSITVVTRERIRDLSAQGIQDALNYAAGVRSDAYGLDARTDSVTIRGGYPDEYLDGLRQQLGGYYTSTTRTEPYLLERVEVLRGPASMLFGQGTTAGVVNLVSKQPLAEPHSEIGLRLGSHERRQVEADFTGPLTADGVWRYRVVGLGREADTQVNFVGDDRVALAPSVSWHPSDATRVVLQARYQKDETGSTLQFLPWSGTVSGNPNGKLPTSRFLGEPDFERYDSERLTGGWLAEHRFNDQWTVRQNFRYTRNEVIYQTMYPDVYSSPDAPFLDAGQTLLNRYAYGDDRKVRLLTVDQHAQGLLSTGALRHQVLLGLDAVRSRETGATFYDYPEVFDGTPSPVPVNAFDPVFAGYMPPPLIEGPETRQRQVGVYLQDQISAGESWRITAGLRHDRARNALENADPEKSRATTKRLGVLYLLPGGWAPYVSYSESFTPVGGVDFFGARFTPLRGKQSEAGVKFESPDKLLNFNAAVYDLREENRLTADPAVPLNQIQAGSTRNRGVELEWVGSVLPALDVAAHYNYIQIDEQLEAIPKHQLGVWSTYRFSGFSTGLGVRFFGAFKDGGAPETPDVTLLDAMVSYEREAWRYSINAQNLTDKSYESTCLRRGDCFYGARLNVMASATYRF